MSVGKCIGGNPDIKRFRLDRFTNHTAANALNAYAHRFVCTVGKRHMHLLQVWDELAARDSGDFGTDTAQILCFTTGFDTIAHLDFLAARFTLSCHLDLYC